SKFILQILIFLGALILFLGSYYLNKRTKAPKGVDVPEKCLSCLSQSCIIKTKDIEKIKEELRKEIDNCDGNNYEEK
ncbi:MAG TPA: hypothetical protein VIK94_04085, partial [Bacilli bacterium]